MLLGFSSGPFMSCLLIPRIRLFKKDNEARSEKQPDKKAPKKSVFDYLILAFGLRARARIDFFNSPLTLILRRDTPILWMIY